VPDLKFILSLSLVGTLVGVVIGWLLKEISEVLRFRREDRRAIGRVLADLMEIRHRLLGVKKVLDEIIERFKIPPQDQLFAKNLMDTFLPSLQNLSKRYEEGVNAIASKDPMLAFQLHSMGLLGPYISHVSSIASMAEESATIWSQVEAQLIELAKPEYERAILKLSRIHSWRTWLYVRRYIRKPLEIPPEAKELMLHIANQSKET